MEGLEGHLLGLEDLLGSEGGHHRAFNRRLGFSLRLEGEGFRLLDSLAGSLLRWKASHVPGSVSRGTRATLKVEGTIADGGKSREGDSQGKHLSVMAAIVLKSGLRGTIGYQGQWRRDSSQLVKRPKICLDRW